MTTNTDAATILRDATIDTPEFRKMAEEWGCATFDPVNIIDEIASRNLWGAIVTHINQAIRRNNNAA